MNLKQYIENLQELVEDNPELNDLEVVYAKDEEGNGFKSVYFGPTVGYFNSREQAFVSEKEYGDSPNDYEFVSGKVNSVCIN